MCVRIAHVMQVKVKGVYIAISYIAYNQRKKIYKRKKGGSFNVRSNAKGITYKKHIKGLSGLNP